MASNLFLDGSDFGGAFSRFARWYMFKPKILILIILDGNGKGWYILYPFGMF
jgi:hypothetical protein